MLLMWSGGCDSTYILAERLKAKEGTRTISVSHPQFSHNQQQLAARRAIVAHFKHKGVVWPHIEVEIKNRYPFGFKRQIQLACTLPSVWLGIAAPYLDAEEDLGVAYIKGDNAIHWLGGIQAAFVQLQTLSFRTGKLELPAEWLSKAQILDGLKRHHLGGKTWWCESPENGRKCGRCSPCMTHKIAQWTLSTKNDFKLHGKWTEANPRAQCDRDDVESR